MGLRVRFFRCRALCSVVASTQTHKTSGGKTLNPINQRERERERERESRKRESEREKREKRERREREKRERERARGSRESKLGLGLIEFRSCLPPSSLEITKPMLHCYTLNLTPSDPKPCNPKRQDTALHCHRVVLVPCQTARLWQLRIIWGPEYLEHGSGLHYDYNSYMSNRPLSCTFLPPPELLNPESFVLFVAYANSPRVHVPI